MFSRFLILGALALNCILLTEGGLCIVACYLLALIISRIISKHFQKSEIFPALLLGALIPLAPMFGSGTLIGLTLSYLLLKRSTLRISDFTWGSPYLLVTCAWVIATIWWHFDLQAIRLIYSGAAGPGSGGANSLYDWIKHARPEWLVLLQFWTKLALFIALCTSLQRETKDRKFIIQGLLIGLFPALALTFLQLLNPKLDYFINQTSFWTGQERITGTFSDPNAFGVFVALWLPLLFAQCRNKIGKERILLLLLCVAWILLAFFSGSRCFFLGLLFYALYLLYNKSTQLFVCMLLLSVLGILLANTSYVMSFTSSLPITLERVLVSVQLPHLSSAFHSRIVFTKLGLAIWLDNPLLGIGFNNFRDAVVPYAQALSLGTGLWIDNSNDFYLGILAETGILGGLALILTLCNLKRDHSGSIFRVGIYCLALLLLLGPHLDFDEVALLSAILFSLGFQFASRAFLSKPLIILAPIIFASVLLRVATQERGLFAWEKEGKIHYRWTERRALVPLECNQDQQQVSLWIRGTVPDLGSNPMHVVIEKEKEKQELLLNDYNWSAVSFSCTSNSHFSVAIESNRIWSPQFYGHASDHRVLALQVSLIDPR